MYLTSYRFWILIIYICIIIVVSSVPSSQMRSISIIWEYDKYVHFFEYFVFGYLLLNAFMISELNWGKWIVLFSSILLLPVLDESVQYFTPGRVADIYDGLADIAGGLSGLFFRHFLK